MCLVARRCLTVKTNIDMQELTTAVVVARKNETSAFGSGLGWVDVASMMDSTDYNRS